MRRILRVLKELLQAWYLLEETGTSRSSAVRKKSKQWNCIIWFHMPTT
jgi:hypothetical protein